MHTLLSVEMRWPDGVLASGGVPGPGVLFELGELPPMLQTFSKFLFSYPTQDAGASW